MLDEALARLTRAAETDGLPEALGAALSHPRETLEADLTLRRDDGSILHIPAWRCRYSDALGPTKGGIRFNDSVNGEEVRTLAFWMTIKCALMGLPYGGAKGGARVDVRDLSTGERERLSRGWMRCFAALVGPDRDIPAPDVGTGAPEMAWMADEYALMTGTIAPHVVTGKPVVLGGLPERHDATGKGAFHVLCALSEPLGVPEGGTIAVQGFGAGGRVFARRAAEAGYRVVCVSDSAGAVFDGDGLDLEAVEAAKDEEGRVDAGPGEALDRDALFEVDCDLLVPAALGGIITPERAGALKAGAILEIANGPVTTDADETLRERGITVAPDVLANAGGVYVSWLEWAQTKRAIPHENGYVDTKLEGALHGRAKAMSERAGRHDGDLRLAAYALAGERLATALSARGAL